MFTNAFYTLDQSCNFINSKKLFPDVFGDF